MSTPRPPVRPDGSGGGTANPEVVRRIAATRPPEERRTEVFAGSGHGPHLDAADARLAVLTDFLSTAHVG